MRLNVTLNVHCLAYYLISPLCMKDMAALKTLYCLHLLLTVSQQKINIKR